MIHNVRLGIKTGEGLRERNSTYLNTNAVRMIALSTLGAGDHLALLSLPITATAHTDVLVEHEAVLSTDNNGRVGRVIVILLRRTVPNSTLGRKTSK